MEKAVEMDFGDKVRSLRTDRELSTTELAKLSGLSQSFISDIENKRRPSPTGKTISKLSKALRVDPTYFLLDQFEPCPENPKRGPSMDYKALKNARTFKVVFLDNKAMEVSLIKMDNFTIKAQNKRGIFLIPKHSIKYFILQEFKEAGEGKE